MADPGRVYLVGAGPGDPGLITVAGLERLAEADVVVYDRLASPRLLEHCRDDADLIFMGKVGGGEQADQDAINRLLVEKGLEGKIVVRLKGGDPFVFGRGGEEAEALRQAGIPFEVVPGVTSAVAVPAYAGIPVTHRGVATSFAVITGHEDPGKEESALNWDKLATAVDTLVLMMGIRTLPDVIGKLIAHGRSPDTPVAVIRWGTTPDHRTVTGTLRDIVDRIQRAGLTPPAISVVGEVVRLRETLSWFEDRPLLGKRVLVTRTRRQASVLAQLLEKEAAMPVELAAIEIEPTTDLPAVQPALDILTVGGYAWAVFTSANAVEIFFDLLAIAKLDARAFGRSRVAAIGPGTADALKNRGIKADAVPSEFIAESVVDTVGPQLNPGDRILIPRADNAREELIDGFRRLGALPDQVILYRATTPEEAPREALSLLAKGGIDIVTFTSSSTVRNLVEVLGEDVRFLQKPLIACIGPITARTAEEYNLKVDVVATEHTIPGLVEAIKEHILRRRYEP